MKKQSKKKPNIVKNNLIALGVVIVIVAISIFIGSSSKKEQPTEQKQSSQPTSNELSRSDVESYCQDAELLNKYINISNISIVTLDYSPNYYQMQDGYDSKGNPFYYLSWSGKDKKSKSAIPFSCWISGTKGDITLHYLSINGSGVFGELGFDVYNKDGSKQ